MRGISSAEPSGIQRFVPFTKDRNLSGFAGRIEVLQQPGPEVQAAEYSEYSEYSAGYWQAAIDQESPTRQLLLLGEELSGSKYSASV